MLGSSAAQLVGRRYQLHEKLGEGGMGEVFRATDRLTGQTVALKRVLILEDDAQQIHSDTVDFRLTLAQEFKLLASMRHPHIISVLDYGFHDKHPYVAMELIERARSFIDAGTDATLEQQVRLLTELLQALAYLHRRGILHHDLKPGNVLVTNDNKVKVLDFGLAAELGKKSEITGTLAYMAPELLLEEEATRASDLYAVGVMAYELLAGQHPFDTSSVIVLVNQVISQNADLSLMTQHFNEDTAEEERDKYAKVVDIINRLLAKNPHERYDDAYMVIQELCVAINQAVPQESAAIRESFLQAAEFVGRELELEQLNDALMAAEDESGSSWLISGESGVGKSRLLEELRIRAMVQGITVLNGQSVADGGLPYLLWRAPLRRLILTTEIDDVDAGILKDLIPDIDTLLEHPIPEPAPVDGAAYQQRLIGTIVSLFQRQTQPFLLMLEDLHWATESLEVLKVLNGIAKELPLLIVASYRHDERPTLSDELPNMRLLRLERFRREHIEALSVSMLGEVAQQKNLIDLLTRETEGNVYFLIEVVRVLAEEAGRLSEVGRNILPERVLAGGVQNIIQRRLARVPQEGRRLLELAAIGGRELDLNILEYVKGPTNLEDWLTICANSAVLEAQDSKWRFAHDKLRLATLDTITPEHARELHRQIANAIEHAYPDKQQHCVLLVHHWNGAGNKVKERFYAQMAGEQALHINNFVEAIEYFERAMALLSETINPGEDIRSFIADLSIKLAEALQYTGDYGNAARHLETGLTLSRAVHDTARTGKALLLMGDLAWRQGNYEDAKKACEEGLELCRTAGDQRGVAKALNRIGMVYQEQGDYTSASQQFTESLSVASENNEPQGMTDAINNLGVLAFTQGNLGEATGYFEQTLSIARSTGERRKAAAALLNLGGAAGAQENYDRAQSYLEETLDICRSIGERRGVALALHNLGVLACDRKEYAKSLPYLDESLMISRSIGNRFGEAQTLSQMGDVARMLGDNADAIARYREALEVAEKVKIVPMILNILVALAEVTQKKEQALAWLGLVSAHPAASQNSRNRANTIVESWNSALTKEEITAGLERGKNLDLTEVVKEILGAPA